MLSALNPRPTHLLRLPTSRTSQWPLRLPHSFSPSRSRLSIFSSQPRTYGLRLSPHSNTRSACQLLRSISGGDSLAKGTTLSAVGALRAASSRPCTPLFAAPHTTLVMEPPVSMPGGHPRCTGIAARLWKDSLKVALQSLYSPFVVALAQGTLPRESFQHYVQQDAFFLDHFALAYQLCLKKASHLPESVQAILRDLLSGVDRERELHAEYAARWGVSLDDCQPSAASKAYTDFLIRVASSPKPLDHVLAAMVPCSRLYGFLGCQLAEAYGVNEALPYSDWIKTYSSKDYLAVPDLKERLLEELSSSTPYDDLACLYAEAMQLELEFFCAQPHAPPPRQVRVFITDFDDTCTERDTSSLLLKAAVQASVASKVAPGPEQEALLASRLDIISQLAQNYVTKYAAIMDSLLPNEGPAVGLEEFFQQMMEFDAKMNAVVVDSGMLKGLQEHHITAASEEVTLKPGCVEALSRVHSAGIPTYVVSLNWSQIMIASVLRSLPCLPTDGSVTAADSGAHVHLRANDVQLDDEGMSTGALVNRLSCGLHKLQLLGKDILPKNAADEGCSIYVGDSASDLPALLAADVGIVIGRSGSLRRVAKAYGIQMKPLCTAPLSPGRRTPEEWTASKVLYEAPSWQHIEAFLFHHSQHNVSKVPAVGGGQVAGPTSGLPSAKVTATPTGQTRSLSTESGPSLSPSSAPRVPRALTIAGSDSGGGAGIQADLKVFTTHGVFGLSVLTALTAQNTHGVHGIHSPPLEFVEQQIDCVLSDIGADVIKTGMLPDGSTVTLVAAKVRQYAIQRLVVDPVITSTSGHSLAGGDVVTAMKQALFPLATIVTPNIPEATALLGGKQIHSVQDMKEAARELHQMGMRYVLLKGGHLLGESGSEDAVDVLFDGQQMLELREPYVVTGNTHGTGCTLASAIAAELAKGRDVVDAVAAAKTYVTNALKRSAQLSIGTGVQKPFNHSFEIDDWGASAGRTPLDLRVYAVTDPFCNKKTNRTMVEAVEAALKGGATIIQLREKDTDGGDFHAIAKAVIKVAHQYNVPVLINDRVDVALAAGADGVHVGQSDLPATEARRLLGPGRILGVSVHNIEEAQAAQAAGADYVGAGAVFPTSTKDASVMGLKTLSDICASISIPVVAIGGITADNAALTIDAGCAGVAVVSNIFAAPDPTAATRALLDVVDKAAERQEL